MQGRGAGGGGGGGGGGEGGGARGVRVTQMSLKKSGRGARMGIRGKRKKGVGVVTRVGM